MGDQYIKVGGVWKAATRPYVKRSGVWTPVKQTYVKQAGAWTLEWTYDVTPPDPPVLALDIIDNRYILVSCRLPGASNDPTLRRIRVLALPDTSPTTQFGAGALNGNDSSYPFENWSDWYYNIAPNGHGDSSLNTHKEYPLNPTAGTNLPGGKYYYFAAWAEDFEHNWSIGTFSRIWMPKEGVNAANVIVKEANFQANTAGSITGTTGVWAGEGQLVVRDSPRSNGIFFFHSKITDTVGQNGTPSISSAKIRLSRTNDTGQAVANVRMGWHNAISTGDFNPSGIQEVTTLGTIQKGETKWFNLPTTWFDNYNNGIRGFIVQSGPGAADFLVLNDLETDLRNGEINLVWNETP